MPNYFRGCGAYFGDYSDKQRRDEFGVEANREDDKEGELDCDEPSVLEGLADHQQQRREHERDFIDRERDHQDRDPFGVGVRRGRQHHHRQKHGLARRLKSHAPGQETLRHLRLLQHPHVHRHHRLARGGGHGLRQHHRPSRPLSRRPVLRLC